MCQSKLAMSYSHTTISPRSFPAIPSPERPPVTMAFHGPWDRTSTSPQNRSAKSHTSNECSRAFPCGQQGQEESLGASGEGAEGEPLCSACAARSSQGVRQPSGSPRDKGRESWNYLGGKGPLKFVQSKPLQRAGTSSARSCCSKPHHGLTCFQGRGMHHLSGQPESVFHHPHRMKFSPYI